MWPKVGMLALAASLMPLGACAQSSNDSGGGPSPDMKAQMDTARGNAKTAAFAALSDDHRAKVQAIVDSFDASGSTVTVPAAALQIDAILTKDESKAALDQEKSMRDAMRAAFSGNGGGPSGGGPGMGGPGGPGGPGGGGPGRGGFGGHRRTLDAGRFLLSVDADQTRYRDEMRAERGAQ